MFRILHTSIRKKWMKSLCPCVLCLCFCMYLYVCLWVCVCVYCVVVSMNLCVWLRMLRHAPGTSVQRKPKYRMPTCMLGRWHVIAKWIVWYCACCAVCCVLCGGVQCCVALWCAVLLQGLVCCGVTVCYVMSCAASEMQSIECIYRLGELCKYGYSFVV